LSETKVGAGEGNRTLMSISGLKWWKMLLIQQFFIQLFVGNSLINAIGNAIKLIE
jgi:hypothetical protein